MKIRKVQPEDLESVFKLTKLFATSFKIDRELFEISYLNLLSDSSTHFLLAEVNDLVIGYSLGYDHYALYANGRVAWIEEIFVLEEYRRNGVASSLMNEMEKWAISRNAKLIALVSRRAKDFYLSIRRISNVFSKASQNLKAFL